MSLAKRRVRGQATLPPPPAAEVSSPSGVVGPGPVRRRTAAAADHDRLPRTADRRPYFGIVQGRLSPPSAARIQAFPSATWRAEFAAARDAGLDGIEWLVEDEYEEPNPLWSASGLTELLELSAQTGVRVASLCADCFMSTRLVHTDGWLNRPAVQRLGELLTRAAAARIGWMVLPFLDSSRLSSSAELAGLRRLLAEVLPQAATAGVALHLETDLPPLVLAGVLREFDSPNLRVTLDTGNSASLGHDPNREIPLLAPWLGSVHIKDRRRGGTTVPLGAGHAAFATIFARLAEVCYHGPFILQTARGVAGAELDLAIRNRTWLMNQLDAARAAISGQPGGM